MQDFAKDFESLDGAKKVRHICIHLQETAQPHPMSIKWSRLLRIAADKTQQFDEGDINHWPCCYYVQVVKLKAFSKFENTTEALAAATSLVDSKLSKGGLSRSIRVLGCVGV